MPETITDSLKPEVDAIARLFTASNIGGWTGSALGTLLWYIDQLKDEKHKKWFLNLLGYVIGGHLLGSVGGATVGRMVNLYKRSSAQDHLSKIVQDAVIAALQRGFLTGLLLNKQICKKATAVYPQPYKGARKQRLWLRKSAGLEDTPLPMLVGSSAGSLAGLVTGLVAWLKRRKAKAERGEEYERWLRDLLLLTLGGYLTGNWTGYALGSYLAVPQLREKADKQLKWLLE